MEFISVDDIDKVVRQTNYTKEEAIENLKRWIPEVILNYPPIKFT